MVIITFSRFDEHSSPLLKSLEIIKFLDLVTFYLAIFMYTWSYEKQVDENSRLLRTFFANTSVSQ